jgi:hypothetical protein
VKLTPERIAEARARCNEATEGPWTAECDPDFDSGEVRVAASQRYILDYVCLPNRRDAVFIAAARTDLPAALDDLDAAMKALEWVQKERYALAMLDAVSEGVDAAHWQRECDAAGEHIDDALAALGVEATT